MANPVKRYTNKGCIRGYWGKNDALTSYGSGGSFYTRDYLHYLFGTHTDLLEDKVEGISDAPIKGFVNDYVLPGQNSSISVYGSIYVGGPKVTGTPSVAQTRLILQHMRNTLQKRINTLENKIKDGRYAIHAEILGERNALGKVIQMLDPIILATETRIMQMAYSTDLNHVTNFSPGSSVSAKVGSTLLLPTKSTFESWGTPNTGWRYKCLKIDGKNYCFGEPYLIPYKTNSLINVIGVLEEDPDNPAPSTSEL